MDDRTREALRRLPSIEELLETSAAHALLERYSRTQVVDALREAVSRRRESIQAGSRHAQEAVGNAGPHQNRPFDPSVDPAPSLADDAARLLDSWHLPHL